MTNQLQSRLRRVERRIGASPAYSLRALLRLLTEDVWPENAKRGFELLESAARAIVGRAVLGEDVPQTAADVERHAEAGCSFLDPIVVPEEREPQVLAVLAALRDSARRHGIGPLMDEQRRKLRHENCVGSGDPLWMWGEPDGAS